jgi:large subunit ribosomal protein L5
VNIKKGDTVEVISGHDKGVRGEVIRVLPVEARVVVQGVNLRKKHQRQVQTGGRTMNPGIIQFEASLHISNVMLVCPKCGQPTRVSVQHESGKRQRVCKSCRESLDNAKALESAVEDVTAITGQRPVVTKARRSIANFKLREGRSIGVKVTLRGERMWSFLDRLMNVALPRTRDFRGVSPDSFDGRGNYTLGVREQLVFPEIDYDKIDKIRGFEVTVVTTAPNDEQGRRLMELLGMPFGRGA